QAEDGIRDFHVTGVQTCALPSICVAAAERPVGLRDSIPVGATLTMNAGSAAQILLAWEEPDRLHRGLREAVFTATILSGVRRREIGRASWRERDECPSGARAVK